MLRVGRGMQRSVSNRPSYLRLWHEFLSIQPKRSPRNPVSDPPRVSALSKPRMKAFFFLLTRRNNFCKLGKLGGYNLSNGGASRIKGRSRNKNTYT